MKFYNPFKAHIVRSYDGTYYVRKWILGWVYLDKDGSHWWTHSFKKHANRMGREELAKQFLGWYKKKDKEEVI